MRKQRNYLNLLGLAQRAGKCISGIDLIVTNIQKQSAFLVLIAQDASPLTKKKLMDKCHSYDVPYVEIDDRFTLGTAIGKEERVAIAIIDQGFAKKLQSLVEK